MPRIPTGAEYTCEVTIHKYMDNNTIPHSYIEHHAVDGT